MVERVGERVLVCVVIPTRNRPHLLRIALRSVLKQARVDLEVVVVDDGSSPPAPELPELQDPRVRLVRNETTRGPAASRNQGAALSDAAFIAFLDDDDRWLPGKLEACLECFSRNPEAGLVFHGAVMEGETAQGSGSCEAVADPVRRMLTQQPPHLDSVLVRRGIHDAVLFDESFGAAEDLDYLLRAAQVTPIVYLDQVLAVHASGAGRSSEIGLEQRIEARKRFHGKHVGHFRDRRARAFYCVRLGHLYRVAGRRGAALWCFGRALVSEPLYPLAWRGVVASLLPGGVVRHLVQKPGREDVR